MAIQQPLVLSNEQETPVQIVVTPTGKGRYKFVISSMSGSTGGAVPIWTVHASGELLNSENETTLVSSEFQDLDEEPSEKLDRSSVYSLLAGLGLEYGKKFQHVMELWMSEGGVSGRLQVPDDLLGRESYILHPTILDSCFHVLGGAALSGQSSEPFLPLGMKGLTVLRPQFRHGRLSCYGKFTNLGPEVIHCNAWLVDDEDQVVAYIDGFQAKRASEDALRKAVMGSPEWERWLYEIHYIQLKLEERSLDDSVPTKWLIFDDGEVSAELRATLQSTASRCVVVQRGKAFWRKGSDDYEISAEPEDYARLINEVMKENAGWQVVHLSRNDNHGLLSESYVELQKAVNLAQALWGRSLQATWVTRCGQSVPNEGPASLKHAPLTGFLRILAKEQPGIRGRQIDVGLEASALDIANIILAENKNV